MSLQAVLNTNNPQQHVDALATVNIGDLLTRLIQNMTATESGVSVTTNLATLANSDINQLWQVNATTATVTGIKKLRQGPVDGSLLPATGECIWDGGVKVLFNVADAVTVASFTYGRAADKASCLLSDFRDIR